MKNNLNEKQTIDEIFFDKNGNENSISISIEKTSENHFTIKLSLFYLSNLKKTEQIIDEVVSYGLDLNEENIEKLKEIYEEEYRDKTINYVRGDIEEDIEFFKKILKDNIELCRMNSDFENGLDLFDGLEDQINIDTFDLIKEDKIFLLKYCIIDLDENEERRNESLNYLRSLFEDKIKMRESLGTSIKEKGYYLSLEEYSKKFNNCIDFGNYLDGKKTHNSGVIFKKVDEIRNINKESYFKEYQIFELIDSKRGEVLGTFSIESLSNHEGSYGGENLFKILVLREAIKTDRKKKTYVEKITFKIK